MIDSSIGYICAILSILSWGSFGLPLKYFNVKLNPILIQIYFSISIFITCWLILIFIPFKFTFIGFIGAAIWIPCSILSFIAIKLAGLAVAQGTWSGFVIVVGFLWGSIYFKEPIESLYLVLIGLISIIFGVLLISACNSQIEIELPNWMKYLYEIDWLFVKKGEKKKEKDEEEMGKEMDGRFDEVDERSPLIILQTSQKEEEEKETIRVLGIKMNKEKGFIAGVATAVVLGIGSGCVYVPVQFLPPDFKGENSILYVISFAIGTLVISFAYFLFYLIYYFVIEFNREMKGEEIRERLIGSKKEIAACLLGGLFWASGNFFATYTILYLGIAIGFPLTQANIVISGLWGIFLLREVRRKMAIIQFFVGTFLVLFGCFMLALFS